MAYTYSHRGQIYYLHHLKKRRPNFSSDINEYYFTVSIHSNEFSEPIDRLPTGYKIFISEGDMPVVIKD